MAKQYLQVLAIRDQAQSLYARGGAYQRAVDQANTIIGRITL